MVASMTNSFSLLNLQCDGFFFDDKAADNRQAIGASLPNNGGINDKQFLFSDGTRQLEVSDITVDPSAIGASLPS